MSLISPSLIALAPAARSPGKVDTDGEGETSLPGTFGENGSEFLVDLQETEVAARDTLALPILAKPSSSGISFSRMAVAEVEGPTHHIDPLGDADVRDTSALLGPPLQDQKSETLLSGVPMDFDRPEGMAQSSDARPVMASLATPFMSALGPEENNTGLLAQSASPDLRPKNEGLAGWQTKAPPQMTAALHIAVPTGLPETAQEWIDEPSLPSTTTPLSTIHSKLKHALPMSLGIAGTLPSFPRFLGHESLALSASARLPSDAVAEDAASAKLSSPTGQVSRVIAVSPQMQGIDLEQTAPVSSDPLVDGVDDPEVIATTSSGTFEPRLSSAISPLMKAASEFQLVRHQIVTVVVELAKPGAAGTVEVSLSPKELGGIRIEMQPRPDGLHIHLVAERPETSDLIRRHLDQLLTDLRTGGFSQTTFSFGQWSHRQPAERLKAPDQPDDSYFVEMLDERIVPSADVFSGRLHLRL